MNMDDHQKLKWSAGVQTSPKTYVTRVFNFGTWEEWQDMKRRFSMEIIQDAVKNPLRGQWTLRGKAFAEAVFDCRLPNNTLISYDV